LNIHIVQGSGATNLRWCGTDFIGTHNFGNGLRLPKLSQK